MELGAVRPAATGVGLLIRELSPGDRDAVRDALSASGAFSGEEIAVALELFDAGPEAGYWLLGAESEGRLLGYVCLGEAPLTQSSWYLYWLCVHPGGQGRGAGRALDSAAGAFAAARGGKRMVVETSGRPAYERARRFYERAGYAPVGRIPDFYSPGDDCVIYWRVLAP